MQDELSAVWAKLDCEPLDYHQFHDETALTDIRRRRPILDRVLMRQTGVAALATEKPAISNERQGQTRTNAGKPVHIIDLFTENLQKAG